MKTAIEMAREAGFDMPQGESFYQAWPEELERFAELVRADEREACAKMCEEGLDTEHPTVKGHIMKAFGKSSLLAAAIRARGENT